MKNQKSYKRVDGAFLKVENNLKSQFEKNGLVWPARYMYIRSFKWDGKFEIWVKDQATDPYKLFKTYDVCAMAGNLGPKRYEGDFQVPEGFYYINEFKPNSSYHLALGVNYPNASDRILSDKKSPGGAIYVHGSCVTVGCIPMTDEIIEEVYVLTASTHAAGQDFIPIHVFPVMFTKDKSKEALNSYLDKYPDYKPQAFVLEKVYYYFELKKQLPTIFIKGNGEYSMLEDFTIPKRPPPVIEPPVYVFKENTAPRNESRMETFTEQELNIPLTKQAEFPGGNEVFKSFVKNLNEDLAAFLPKGKDRAFVPVNFIVNAKGKVVNIEVGKAGNNEMNNLIIERFQKLPEWKPALDPRDNPIPKRLTQTFIVDAIIGGK